MKFSRILSTISFFFGMTTTKGFNNINNNNMGPFRSLSQPWPLQYSVIRRNRLCGTNHPSSKQQIIDASHIELKTTEGETDTVTTLVEGRPSYDSLDIENNAASDGDNANDNDEAAAITTIQTPSKASLCWSSVIENPSLTTGRVLVMLASALYGTNFAIVKLVDQTVPTPISAAMRFSLSAVVVAAWVLRTERAQQPDEQRASSSSSSSSSRFWATVFGAEVGLFYCAGYITQALALQTVEASYVSWCVYAVTVHVRDANRLTFVSSRAPFSMHWQSLWCLC